MSYLALAKQVEARLSGREPSLAAPFAQDPKPTPVPALCQALRAFFAMTAREVDGDLPAPEEAQALLSEIRRLWDDVGPAFAKVVSREEAWAYYRETRRCPYCGEPGVFHDPERGGEPA